MKKLVVMIVEDRTIVINLYLKSSISIDNILSLIRNAGIAPRIMIDIIADWYDLFKPNSYDEM